MLDKKGASFLHRKRGIYYFSKQVPCDINAHYSRIRVAFCIKTRLKATAERMTILLIQRLEDYLLSLKVITDLVLFTK